LPWQFLSKPIANKHIQDGTATKAGNPSLPFYFLFGLSLISMLLLYWFVDLKKSRIEQDAFLEEERQERERRASIVSIRRNSATAGAGMSELTTGSNVPELDSKKAAVELDSGSSHPSSIEAKKAATKRNSGRSPDIQTDGKEM
jgi:hypothetical protein